MAINIHNFDDIRPYRDDEVRGVLDGLLKDLQLSRSLAKFRYPSWYRWFPAPITLLVQLALKKELRHVNTVREVQIIIEKYLDKLIETTTSSLTQSGVELLDNKKPYLFISNHRDITMDPALVNYMLYHHGKDTMQIAIGDNLLKRPFLSSLMKLNKSFTVKRSLQGRAKLTASKQLSAYIKYCIELGENVWIAQREGRAKDGIDKTESAIIKMLQLASREAPNHETLAAALNQLNIIPVAISYEFDPCDGAKAAELHAKATTGSFVKDENTDMQSILTGIVGNKGSIHVSFGQCLVINDAATADDVVDLIDAQIINNYHLHLVNYLALEIIQPLFMDFNTLPNLFAVSVADVTQKRQEFVHRLQTLAPVLQPFVLNMYANPVIRKAEMQSRSLAHGM